jgi:hypothetical protein
MQINDFINAILRVSFYRDQKTPVYFLLLAQ